MSVIDYEITYLSNPRSVFHDSLGIEAIVTATARELLRIAVPVVQERNQLVLELKGWKW